MFVWLKDGLKAGDWFPQKERKLTDEQIEYIKEILACEFRCLENIEINLETGKVRKDAVLNCVFDKVLTREELISKILKNR